MNLKALAKAILKKADEDYRIQHTAPTSDGGAPIHNLSGVFPDDVYGPKGAQYYGHSVPYDHKAIAVLSGSKGRPEAKVRIYRSVPKIKTNADKINELTAHKAYIQKTGKIPKDAWKKSVGDWGNRSEYYDFADTMIESLKARPEIEVKPMSINRGDWITTTREYAKLHGDGVHGAGNHTILTKLVPAKHVYSDGNSIHEYGYDPGESLSLKPKMAKSSSDRKDLIPGGLADGKKPSDFPKKSIQQGSKVEREHTSSKAIAKEIAMDHLTEDPKYYDKLKTIEKSDGSKKEVASIAVISGDRLLMGKRNDNGRFTLPGGHLNPGEKPLAGAARELLEETGIKVDPKDLDHLGSEEVTTFTGKQMVIHSYACYGHFDTNTELDPDNECQNWVYVDISNGLPHNIARNLHSPKNTTLKILGLQ